MKRYIILILLFLVGCSNVSVKNEKDLVDNLEKEKVIAYIYEDYLYVEVEGEINHYFVGDISSKDSQEYTYSFNYLNSIEGSKLKTPKDEEVKILDGQVWDRIYSTLLDDILPKEKKKGLLLVTYYYEVIIYRDEFGNIVIDDLIDLNKEVEIVGRLENNQVAELSMGILKDDYLEKNNLDGDKFLFVTNNNEDYPQPFTYVDLNKQSLIYYFLPSRKSARNPDYVSFIANNTLGLINNPFTVTGRFFYWLINSGYVIASPRIKDIEGEIPPLYKGEGMDIEDFRKYLDKKVSSKEYRGSVDVLIDGEEYFLDLINSIYNAEKEINIRTYIFDNDDYAVKIADILKGVSEEVEVKILMDELGSVTAWQALPNTSMPLDFEFPTRIDDYLEKNSEIKTRTAINPWFTTDHVKTLIFDNKSAYIGGMNIGREYRYEWHDIMLKVEGPVVGRLNKEFYGAWAHSGWGGDIAYAFSKMFKSDKNKMLDKEEYIDIRPLYTKTGKTEIHDVTLEAIKRAKSYIYIQNAYFSDNRIINELIRARERGVDVRIILPYWGNHNIMNSANMISANIMLRNGIKVYLYPSMTHVKATIIDDWAMVGTANYDKLSMRVNQEMNLSFYDKEVVEELLDRLFYKDFEVSMEVQGEFPIPWYNHVLKKVLADQL